MTAEARLIAILRERHIRAFPPFSIGVDDPVVCFSEVTLDGLHYLTAGPHRRYEPYGLAFAKQTVFDRGGGPALYVRGDEWDDVTQLPTGLRARVTRFWPGADPDPGESLPGHLQGPSLWSHEREWRTIDPAGFPFSWEQITYILVPDQAAWQRITDAVLEPLQDEAFMLSTAFDDDDPVVWSARNDVEVCAAALADIWIRTLDSSNPSRRTPPASTAR
jgi:hypothetical protein